MKWINLMGFTLVLALHLQYGLPGIEEYPASRIPLKHTIKELSTRFDVNFSYVEELVENVFVENPKKYKNLDKCLRSLEDQTGLVFERMDNSNVIIYPNKADYVDICGSIYDLETNLPLGKAKIVIKGKGEYSAKEDGSFEIKDVHKQDKLRIGHVGYPDQELLVTEFVTDSCRDIFLSYNINQLQEVVVVKNKQVTYNNGKIQIDTKGKVNLTTPSSLEPDSFELIKWMPSINYGNESVSNLQIRGGSPDHNLISYDGITLFGTEHLFGAFSFVNPYLTESIELDKGMTNPKYGNRLSGSLKINTASGIVEKDQYGLVFSGTNGNAFFKERIGDDFSLLGSFRHSINPTGDGQNMLFEPLLDRLFEEALDVSDDSNLNSRTGMASSELVENSGDINFRFYDTFLKFIYQPTDRDILSVSGLFSRNMFNFSGISEQRMFQDEHEVENIGGSFKWTGTKGKAITHTFELNYSNFGSEYFGREPSQLSFFVSRDYAIEELGLNANISYKISDKHRFALGYQYSFNKVANTITRNREDIALAANSSVLLLDDLENNSIANSTIYLGYGFTPTETLDFSVGLRNTSYSSSLLNELVFEPIINLGYAAANLSGNLSVSRRYQSISQLVQNNDRALRFENELWVIADNSSVPLLQSDQISAGLNLDKNGWELDLDVFYKQINGITTLSRSFIDDTSNEFDQGANRVFGVGFFLGKQLGKFNSTLSYSFNDSKVSYDDFETAFPSNIDIRHTLRVGNTFTGPVWQFSLGFTYRSGAPFTEVANFTQNNTERSIIAFGPTNAARLPAYHRMDLSGLYKFKLFTGNTKRNAALGMVLNNVYDSRILLRETYQLYFNRNAGGDLHRLRLVSQGFTPNFIFRCTF